MIRRLAATLAAVALAAGAATAADPPGAKLSAAGHVVTADGAPVAGATVHLRQWPALEPWLRPADPTREVLATATTDEQGRFAFRGVASGYAPDSSTGIDFFLWDVVVVAKGFGLAFKPLTLRNRRGPMVLALRPEAPLRGRVVDGAGKPLAGVRLWAEELWPFGTPSLVSVSLGGYYERHPDLLTLERSALRPGATTDDRGRFVLAGLPADTWVRLRVEDERFGLRFVSAPTTEPSPGDAPNWPGEEVRPATPGGEVTLTLRPGCRLRGRVVREDDGKPVAAARVRISVAGLYWSPEPAVTDADGRFRIGPLPAGKGRLYVESPADGDCLSVAVGQEVPANRPEVECRVRCRAARW
jgi:protocatechuate 3,4-dioxygenase beta subunit